MATSLNRTIDTCSQVPTYSDSHLSLHNLSFAGFTYSEIHSGKKWQVIPRTMSTTISVDKEYIHEVLYHIRAMHGPSSDRGKKGLIFKSLVPSATITVYLSTATISVQGSQHIEWVDTILPEIQDRIDFDNAPDIECDNESVNFPITSTPRSSISDDDESLCTCTSSTSQVISTQHSSTQAGPILCERFTQTPVLLDETPKLKDTICSLRAKVEDYKKQLTEFQQLRNNFTQLTSAYRELSDRNSILQAEVVSLKAEKDSFQTPKNCISHIPPPPPAAIPTSNKFDILPATVSTDEVPTSSAPAPTTPSAPRISSQSPKIPARKPVQPQNPSSKPIEANKEPQILIFSNSICKRINGQKFYRGRTTEVIAKSGASINDVKELIKNCTYEKPNYVILQAWTNNASHENANDCENKARSLIELALHKYPTAHIIISSGLPRLIPLTKNNVPNQTLSQLNKMFAGNCKMSNRVTFADHTDTFVTQSGEIREDCYYDYVHLNNHGLGKLVINLRRAIDSVYFQHTGAQPMR